MEDTLTHFMQMSITKQKNIDAFVKNLEVRVGQLAKQLSEHGSGYFSTNTQVNPKEPREYFRVNVLDEVIFYSKRLIQRKHFLEKTLTEAF